VFVENKLDLWDFGHGDGITTAGLVVDEGLLPAQ
jgi:hypothetical protein